MSFPLPTRARVKSLAASPVLRLTSLENMDAVTFSFTLGLLVADQ